MNAKEAILLIFLKALNFVERESSATAPELRGGGYSLDMQIQLEISPPRGMCSLKFSTCSFGLARVRSQLSPDPGIEVETCMCMQRTEQVKGVEKFPSSISLSNHKPAPLPHQSTLPSSPHLQPRKYYSQPQGVVWSCRMTSTPLF